MKFFIKKRVIRFWALLALAGILNEVLLPTVAFALTSGPNQPEFSSFEPVATTNMVNEFTGDFTYNLPVLDVPGPHGSGYSMSLSYHSGVTPEEEGSWVGYGWSMNSGSILRGTRGFPDDYKGKFVKYFNTVPNNWTVTAGGGGGFEVISIDAGLSLSSALRYNNYKGFGYNAGLGISLGKGAINLGYNVSDGEGSYSLSINPRAMMNSHKEKASENAKNSQQQQTATTALKETNKKEEKSKKSQQNKFQLQMPNLFGSSYGIFSHSEMVRPSQVTKYDGFSVNVSLGLMGTVTPIELGLSANVFGSFSLQHNLDRDLPAFGYMYSEFATSDDDAMMDYYVEKESPYQKHDVFLGIPFNNADNYSLSGEGLGGGFRMYNKKTGQFRPNKVVSKNGITNVGAEIELPINFGGGVDVGAGYSQLAVKDWNETLSFFKRKDNEKVDEQLYFRYNNDLGGSIDHPTGDVPVRANIAPIIQAPGKKYFDADISNIKWDGSSDERNGRSSYIAYHTNYEISTATKPGYQIYTLGGSQESFLNRANDRIKDGIGEIVTYNETGSRYIYGLPVYSKGEKNLQHSAKGAKSIDIDNNYISYYKNDDVKVGEERTEPYANSFLLTEITTPDFVDRTLNGPSNDDFGGYTKFNYDRSTGGLEGASASNWFKWRLPYNGLMYHRNSLSDPKDDMVSYSEGEKEIYYLKSVETKTHVAIFETSARNDGKEAADDFLSRTAKGTDGLKKLNTIKLYLISDLPTDANGNWTYPDPANTSIKPIKTTNFRYSEELCGNTPNAYAGKLTLKQVWFEYEGIAEAKISPYVFEYAYPNFNLVNSSLTKYPAKYADLTLGWNNLLQNPDYNRFSTDAWGNYQSGISGQDRYGKMQPWVSQLPPQDFDPAAYQLKVIKLPSGGEIHVQYEQDDYSYVQDQNAHVMVSLKSMPSQGNKIFYLNTADLGATTPQDILNLKKLIENKYKNKEKMYFKFLYKLLDDGVPDLSSCNAEYITGYADIIDVKIDPTNGLYIQLSDDDKRIPEKVCKDFVKTERLGNISKLDCNASTVGLDEKTDPAELANQLLNMARTIVTPGTLCTTINPSLSYFRIPTPVSKKGGGIRVKRLLMFDKGDGTGNDAVLYGNEYDYKQFDSETGTVRSSGVATNEPSSIREENPMVSFIARKQQSLLNRIIAGKDKKQSEGPLGESIMPGASVGYARVTIKNIHSGTTNPGFNIKEFYTARDYPVELRLEKVSTDLKTESDYLPLIGGLVNIMINKLWASQGFSFVFNNMHGQVKRAASYGGDYSDIYQLSKAAVSSEQIYTYNTPGTPVPLLDRLGGTLTPGYPGKEVDLTFAQSAVEDQLYDINVEGDADVGFFGWFPIPFISAMVSLTHSETALYTHVTSKVIRYPAILQKITNTQDGVKHVTENLAFDKYTGSVVAVRSWDDHTGSYLAQEIPASWLYDNMRPKAMNEGKQMDGIAFQADATGSYVGFNSSNTCSLLSSFSKGDLIAIGTNFFHVSGFDYVQDRLRVVPSYLNPTANPSTATSLTIVRSGKTNNLNDKGGQITFHGVTRDILPPSVNEADRYTDDALSIALNNALLNKTGTGSLTLTLPATYFMNMSNYSSCLPSGCQVDMSSINVKQITYAYVIGTAQVSLNMLSFVIACNGQDITLNCINN